MFIYGPNEEIASIPVEDALTVMFPDGSTTVCSAREVKDPIFDHVAVTVGKLNFSVENGSVVIRHLNQRAVFEESEFLSLFK